jgi:hypothetical protein
MLEGFKQYKEYLKHNPEGYWFKRKAFGWGWTPVKWQGWVATLVYIILLMSTVILLENFYQTINIFVFIIPITLFTSLFIWLCYKKGEKPKWTWGFPKDE